MIPTYFHLLDACYYSFILCVLVSIMLFLFKFICAKFLIYSILSNLRKIQKQICAYYFMYFIFDVEEVILAEERTTEEEKMHILEGKRIIQ